MMATRLSSTSFCLSVVAGCAVVVIVAATGWRTGALALLAGMAVVATRVRFSGATAAMLLVLVATATYLLDGGA